MCHPLCGVVHIKDPLLLIEKTGEPVFGLMVGVTEPSLDMGM